MSTQLTTKLTVTGPAEAVAAVDHVMGFTPSESLVMLTFGATNGFHDRVDLPPLEDQYLVACSQTMLAPAVQHHVQTVLLITYSAKPTLQLRGLIKQLSDDFANAGITVLDALHVCDGMVYDHFPQPGAAPIPVHNTKADVLHTQMVAEGHRAPEISREALAQRLHGVDTSPVGDQVLEVLRDRLTETDSSREPEIVLELVVDAMNGARALSDVDVARIAVSTRSAPVRDELLGFICRNNAAAFVDVFTDLVRRTPIEHREWPATLLAFGAWQAGHGAIAWIALEEANPGGVDHDGTQPNALAEMVALVLTKALPPSIWEDVRSSTTS